jgi:hypothetical protein
MTIDETRSLTLTDRIYLHQTVNMLVARGDISVILRTDNEAQDILDYTGHISIPLRSALA